MILSREIGGYLELECNKKSYLYDGAYVNSGRNALRYFIRANQIRSIYVSCFTCPVVWHTLEEEGCHVHFYKVNRQLEPVLDNVDPNAYIILNNYFGIQNDLMRNLVVKYPNSIIDNAQAFYAPMMGLASFYSPRKFFGLPDGGILLTNLEMELNLSQDKLSHQRCEHLLIRYDLGANAGYSNFIMNDHSLDNLPLESMSSLTYALMGNIDYDFVKERRRVNFKFLHDHLGQSNLLDICLQDEDVPLVYPFVTQMIGLREILIKHKVYIAKYWPNLEKNEMSQTVRFFQDHLIALPIDQRYGIDDMKKILTILKSLSALEF